MLPIYTLTSVFLGEVFQHMNVCFVDAVRKRMSATDASQCLHDLCTLLQGVPSHHLLVFDKVRIAR